MIGRPLWPAAMIIETRGRPDANHNHSGTDQRTDIGMMA